MSVAAHLSPYCEYDKQHWPIITEELVEDFFRNSGLVRTDLVSLVTESWADVYSGSFGEAKVGKDIFLTAQAIGSILHTLVGMKIGGKCKGWRGEIDPNIDKDAVCTTNPFYSFEFKSSSSASEIVGNASVSDPAVSTGLRKIKVRSGYYLILNHKRPTETDGECFIRSIRFGWLDDGDFIPWGKGVQTAKVKPEIQKLKLQTLYKHERCRKS